MKKFRKISALMLALALICTLAVSAFATVRGSSATVTCYDVDFHTEMVGTITYAKANTVVEIPGSGDFSALITLSNTVCVEDQIRPTNYEVRTVTRTFTRYSGTRELTYSAPSGYVMIDATGKTKITKTVSGALYNTTTAPVTIGLY